MLLLGLFYKDLNYVQVKSSALFLLLLLLKFFFRHFSERNHAVLLLGLFYKDLNYVQVLLHNSLYFVKITTLRLRYYV